MSFGDQLTSDSTLTINLEGGGVTGLDRIQGPLSGLTVNSNSGITLPAIAISGPQEYNTGVITVTGNLVGVGITFNNVVQVTTDGIELDAGTGALAFNDLLNFNDNDLILTGDKIDFASSVTGTGALTLQPSTVARDIQVGGDANGGTVLDLTSGEIALLPSTLASLTMGCADGTGAMTLASALDLSSSPLTLNAGGGLGQSAALTADVITIRSAGAAITLDNGENTLGDIAITGTPSSVTITDTTPITQYSSWVLGDAAVTLDAGSHEIVLTQDGNTFGTLCLTGSGVSVTEAADTELGAGTMDTLTAVSSGAITTSGTLVVSGPASFTSLADGGASITVANDSTFGSVSAASRNSDDTADAAGNISIAPGGSTTLVSVTTTGNVTLTAGAGLTVAQEDTGVLTATGLELLGEGTHDLTAGTNAVDVIAGNTGTVGFREVGDYVIGTVNTTEGLAATGTVSLTSTGTVSQTAALSAPGLELRGEGGVFTLTNSANAVGTLAGDTGTVSFREDGDYVIGTVNTIEGFAATGTISLTSTGTVSQTAALSASGLELLGAGGVFTLTNSANAVGTLAGDTGTVSFREDGDYVIGTVNTTEGLASTGTVSLTSTGTVSQTAALSAPGLELLGTGGVFTLTDSGNAVSTLAGNTGDISYKDADGVVLGTVHTEGVVTTGNLTLTAGGEISQTAAFQVGGNFTLTTTHAAGNVVIDNTGAGATVLGDTLVGGNFTLTATGDIVSQAAGTSLQVAGDFTATCDSVVLGGAGNLVQGTTSLPESEQVEIRQSGVITLETRDVAGDFTVVSEATNRSFDDGAISGNAVTLDNSSNSVAGTISVNTVAPSITEGVDVQTGIVQADGATLTVSGLASFTAEESTVEGSGIITLTNTGNSFGTLILSGSTVTVTEDTGDSVIGSADVTTALTITSAGTVTQTGDVTAPSFTVHAGGAVTLDRDGNDVDTLTVDTTSVPGGNVVYADGDGFAIAGIAVDGADVSLTAGGDGDITQTGALTGVNTLVIASGGDIDLDENGVSNSIVTLGTISAGTGVDISDSDGDLVIDGDVSSSAGDILIVAHGGNLTLADTRTITAAGAGNIYLAAGVDCNFTNNDTTPETSALVVESGRFIIYSDNNGDTELGGLSADPYLNRTYAANSPGGVTETGNLVFYNDQVTLTLTAVDAVKTYGDENPAFTYIVTGLLEGDTEGKALSGDPSFGTDAETTSNVGTYTITIGEGTLVSLKGYVFDFVGGSLEVEKLVVTVSADDLNKTYGDSDPALTYATSTSLVGTDSFTGSLIRASGENAGTYGITRNTLAIDDGNGGNNYTLVFNHGTFTIDPRAISITTTAVTKSYDGTLTADGAAIVTAGVLVGDDTISDGTFSFTDANAGNDKTVTVSGVTVSDGNGGGNYDVTYVNNTTSTIEKATLSISTSDVTKTYNGTLTAEGTAVVVSGTLYENASNGGARDSLSGGTFLFTDANAGSDKTVTVGGVTVSDGNGGGNYTVTYVDNTTSTIEKAALSISTGDVTKTYNGTLTAEGTAVVVSGTLYENASNGGVLDTISGGTFVFADADAGSDKTVTVGGVTVSDGNGGGNYTVTYVNNTTSTIGKAALSISTGDVTKTYDGTLTAEGTAVVVSGTLYENASNGGAQDSLSGGTFLFTDADAGSDKTVTVGGVTVSDGNGGGNYTVTYVDNTTSTIEKAALSISTSDVTKTYDGTLTAEGTAVVVSGTLYENASNGGARDSLSGGTFAFADADAGSDKTVTVGGVTVSDGNGGGNYTVTYVDNTTSTIEKATLSISTGDVTKTYDGTLTAEGTAVVVSGMLYENASNGGALDTISGGTFAFADANAGSDKTVTVGGVTVSDGNGGANYDVTYVNNTTSTIEKATLSISAGDVTKAYDGTLTAEGTAVVVSGTLYENASNGGVLDTISGGTFVFADANAGSDKTVTVGGVTVSDGNGGGNYDVTYVNNTTSTIEKATLSISTGDVTKTYNGALAAEGTAVVVSGTLYENASNGGARDSLSGGTFLFTDANAGSDKTVTVGGITVSDGNGGGNYDVTYVNNTTSTIEKATLSISTGDVTKTYNGALAAEGTAVVVSGTLYENASNGGVLDTISGGTFAFADADAGSDKTVTVSGVTVSDGNGGGNYDVTYVNNTTSTIRKASLSISTSDVTKAYDGTLTAEGIAVVVSGTLYENASNGGARDSLSGGTFLFTDANAGSDKTVTVGGVTVSDGNGGGNYDVTYVNNTTNTIGKAALSISTGDVTKTYNGTLTAEGTAVVVSGTLYENASNGGALDTISGGTFAFANANAGNDKTVTVSGVAVSDGHGGGNYDVTYVNNTTSTIEKATLSISTGDVTKTYNGALAAEGTAVVVSGTLYENASNGGARDTISGGTFLFADANAGNDKTVTVSGITVNDGRGGGNYDVTYVNNTTSTIEKAALSISTGDVTKTYNGTLTAEGTVVVVSGTLYENASNGGAQDTISGGTFLFTDANAGSDKTVTVSGVTVSDGHGGGNYDVMYVNNTTSTIEKAALSISTSAMTKTYDGALTAEGTAVVVSGTLYENASNGGAQDSLSGGTFLFTDANAGSDKTVTVSGVTVSDGHGGGNYTVTYVDNTASTIGKAALSISTSAVTKTYDGTLTAEGTAVVVSGTLYENASNGGAQDSLSGGTFAFADANAGSSKTVTVSGVTVIDGNGSGNYDVTYVNNTTSTIERATLSISTSAASKTYDGALTAEGTAVVVSGTLYENASNGGAQDSLSGGTFLFSDANAGSSKTVTVSGVTVIDGHGGGNYDVTYVDNTTSTIEKATLTYVATGAVRTYGDANPSLAGTVTGFVNDENLGTATTGSLTFTTTADVYSNVGAYAVTGSGLTAANYVFVQAGTNATALQIDPATLYYVADLAGREYGDEDPVMTGTVVGLKNGQSLSDATTGDLVFISTADVASDTGTYAISGSGLTANYGNYIFVQAERNSEALTVNQAVLTVTAADVTKTYGDDNPDLTLSYSGFKLSDEVEDLDTAASVSTDADTFSNVGTYVITASGAVDNNYTFEYEDGELTVDPRAISISTTSVTKTYDGTLTADGTAIVTVGSLVGDDIISGGTFAFTDKNAGENKTVTTAGVTVNDGNIGNNYAVTYVDNTSSTIAKATLVVTADGVDRVYDGTTVATVVLSDDRVGGDELTLSYAGASFADKNAGEAKAVSVSGIGVSGTDAGNYEYNVTATTVADVAKATLVVGADGVDRVYDGTTVATVVLSDDRVGGDELTLSYAGASFADKNAGEAKAVSVSGIGVSGTDAGNYEYNVTATTVADVAKATLVVGADGVDRVYDGTTVATVVLSDDRVGGDELTLSYAGASFADKNAGEAKAVSVSGIGVSGTDAGNYEYNVTATTVADVAKATLVVGADGVDRVYDGTTVATVVLSDTVVAVTLYS